MNLAGRRHILNNMIVLLFYLYVAESKRDLIYILSWHEIKAFAGTTGQEYFMNKNCNFQNCFFTYNRSLFNNILHFDVILFNGFEVSQYHPRSVVPHVRSPEQKYIFVSTESPALFPVRSSYNGFFNYTFTYKLDSDIPWRFFVVRDKTDDKVIAPKVDVKWIDINDMEPVSEEIKQKLQSKNQAAAWLVSHCKTPIKREHFVANLVTELEKNNLYLNTSGNYQCIEPKIKRTTPCSYWNKPDGGYSPEMCNKWISANHYFYLAFENSFSEEYVTEKILTATKNFAIPIVFGGADYTKFLPTGSYIHANDMTPKDLASMMNDLIHDKNKYYEYFKWHRYYSIHDPTESPDTDGICALCAFLNDKKHEAITSVYTRITWFFKI